MHFHISDSRSTLSRETGQLCLFFVMYGNQLVAGQTDTENIFEVPATNVACELVAFDVHWFLKVFPYFISQHRAISATCLSIFTGIPPNGQSNLHQELLILASTSDFGCNSAFKSYLKESSLEIIFGELDRLRLKLLTPAFLSLQDPGLKMIIIPKLVRVRLTDRSP
ncbi:hypothetical protein QCA50_014482 [Cerrena zonata]|uniref:Uncharacterized protein n=1 Tax=Cerrena zonata TaxID=2478898 RepID=A0AAW0FT99_9APHY